MSNPFIGEIMMTAVHTPGHTEDHLCYRIADVVFTGDHIMGGSTVIIEDDLPHVWPIFHNVVPEARVTLKRLSRWLVAQSGSADS